MTKQRSEATHKVQINNERVLVTEWRFSPGAETGWHCHKHDYVVVPQSTGKLLLETKEGEITSELVAGESYFRDFGVTHNVINSNDYEFVFIEIEFK